MHSFVTIQDEVMTFVNTEEKKEYHAAGAPRMIRIMDDDAGVFWVAHEAAGDRVYRNGEPISEVYSKIHALNISPTGDHWMVAADMHSHTQDVSLVKDGEFQFSLRSSRVVGSLMMNGFHSLYQIKHEDGSISVVFDGAISDRKLDEIREIYLDSNGGYAYFGRMQ